MSRSSESPKSSTCRPVFKAHPNTIHESITFTLDLNYPPDQQPVVMNKIYSHPKSPIQKSSVNMIRRNVPIVKVGKGNLPSVLRRPTPAEAEKHRIRCRRRMVKYLENIRNMDKDSRSSDERTQKPCTTPRLYMETYCGINKDMKCPFCPGRYENVEKYDLHMHVNHDMKREFDASLKIPGPVMWRIHKLCHRCGIFFNRNSSLISHSKYCKNKQQQKRIGRIIQSIN